MAIQNLKDLKLSGKKVFIRSDLNVPIQNNKIVSTNRIDASIPTIQFVLDHGGTVILSSHLGRPNEGQFDPELSLQPIVDYLSTQFDIKLKLHHDLSQDHFNFESNQIHVLENVRFNKGEKSCDDNLSKQYAAMSDIFVMDAFGTAHRKEASTFGIGKYVKEKCAGLLFAKEVEVLTKIFEKPNHPMLAVVGGSKVSTKLSVLKNLINMVDGLILGGGILNTFIAAQGINIGKSLYEKDFIDEAKKILNILKEKNIFFPEIIDVVCASELSENAEAIIKDIHDVSLNDMILDLGPKTLTQITNELNHMETILWNGPIGVFELNQFSNGTKILSEGIAQSRAYSLAGGGDTIAAIEKFNVTNAISYISTAGGAFLEFAEGKKLPAIEILES